MRELLIRELLVVAGPAGDERDGPEHGAGVGRRLAPALVRQRRQRLVVAVHQGLTLVPISAQLELLCPPYNP
jgi:hypothetical protein